jgi:hypothetical protein
MLMVMVTDQVYEITVQQPSFLWLNTSDYRSYPSNVTPTIRKPKLSFLISKRVYGEKKLLHDIQH